MTEELRRITPGDVDPDLAPLLDWRRLRAVPVRTGNGARAVAVADPQDLPLLDTIRRVLGQDTHFYAVPAEDIELALSSSTLLAGGVAATEDEPAVQAPVEELAMRASEAPIVNLVSSIIRDALARGASDVHIEAFQDEALVLSRVDGVKQQVMRIAKSDLPGVITRIKVMAGMDIAERRLPQDGRIKARDASGELVDIRVSTIPSHFGECACLRILRRTADVRDISSLGMSPRDEKVVRRAIGASWGMVLVCGPTGSGKSTTLSVLLRHIASPEKEILTIEDPVEYHIPHAHQVQVNEKAGLTFARALRSFLRHDPDIIMVGEIRDQETAEIATRAAMTGHLVFSTVHTNDAPSAPARLVDMGVEPFLIASSLTAAIAQRLVRRVCPNCASRVPVDPNLAAALEGACPAHQMRGAGCDQCGGTGYRRRAPIWEVLAVTPEVRALINRGADANAIRDVARKQGMTTLIEDGLRLVRQGVTTVEEVIRVASSEGLAGEAVQ
jgi:type II secretory ATPase GspE/PulE/Tfp pilus assembly ATPase PilB-like protein